ncbi:hypothetical protein HT031_003706 [Scenedesmus sp. PABB004]|nr:hypothetical protein HT031_003706 [Scenedesmus sp. PABB004]
MLLRRAVSGRSGVGCQQKSQCARAQRLRQRCSGSSSSGAQQAGAAAAEEQAAGAAAPCAPSSGIMWSSHVSRRINADLAIEEAVAGALAAAPPGCAPELAIVFVSSAYVAEYGDIVALLRKRLPSLRHVFGSSVSARGAAGRPAACGAAARRARGARRSAAPPPPPAPQGYGVIGTTAEGPEEIEHAPALSVTLARLPGVRVRVRHVDAQQLPDGDAPPQRWADLVGVALPGEPGAQEADAQAPAGQQQQQAQQAQQAQQPPQQAQQPPPPPQQARQEHTNFIILADPEFAPRSWSSLRVSITRGLTSAGKLNPARVMFAWSAEYEELLQQQQQQQRQQQGEPQQQQPQQQEQPQQQQPQQQEQPQQQQPQQQEQPQQQQPQQQEQPQQWQPQQPPFLRTGAVVMALQGPVEMELIVAQGCRPLSPAVYTVERVAQGGIVLALRDEATGRSLSPVEALQQELKQVASGRPELLALLRNIAVGLVPQVLRSAGSEPAPHQYLIRGVALDRAGFAAVGDAVRVGQHLRFMVRAAAAERDQAGQKRLGRGVPPAPPRDGAAAAAAAQVRDRAGAQQDLAGHCLAHKRRSLAAALGGGGGGGGAVWAAGLQLQRPRHEPL